MSQTLKAKSLAYLRESASTARVLNLHRVAEKHGGEDDHSDAPFFRSKRLNTAFVVKHTLSPHEMEMLSLSRISATKVIFPLAHDDLRLGGYSIFVEQSDFERGMIDALGRDGNRERILADIEVLREIARLPSLDPYLLRERLAQIGHKPASCYFDISDADVEKIQTYVVSEISKLVELAYGVGGPQAKAISDKLARLIMQDERSKTLEPLRETLRLQPDEYVEGMFGWKGFLYYKWNISRLRPSFEPIAKAILSTRYVRAHSEDETVLAAMRKMIARTLYMRIGEVDKALAAYDNAYKRLVDGNDPGAFRNFLLRAPHMFLSTGEHLAAINHVCTYWGERFPPGTLNRLEIDDAFDIYKDFNASLGIDDRRLAA